MKLEIYAGPRVAPLLARAQAELGDNAVVVNVHRSRLPNGLTHFQLTAADDAAALALVSGTHTSPVTERGNPAAVLQEKTGPRVIALVGPTGSGKTTAIAKLATNPQAFLGRKVGLLSLDTHRPGGLDQLREYARAARLRVEAAFDVGDLQRIRRRLGKCETILVDTPGRSPTRHVETAAVNEMLLDLAPDEVHLVIPAGLSRRYAAEVMARPEFRTVTHVLLTKLDEYPGDRVMQQLASERGLGIRWHSTGQGVPQDLMLVSPLPVAEGIARSGTMPRRATAA